MSVFPHVTSGVVHPRRNRPVAIALAAILTASGAVATALPAAGAEAPDVPTVFISQLIPSDDDEYTGATGTTLRTATQSRLANDGKGGVEIRSRGAAASVQYNAVGYHAVDHQLYGLSIPDRELLRIDPSTGVITTLGLVAGLPTTGTFAAGAFGVGSDASTLFVKTNTSGSSVYAIDVPTRTVVRTITPSSAFNAIDFTWADGYLWGIEGIGTAKTLIRLDTATGAVVRLGASALFPSADIDGYGAAWTYGNGNVAFSNNHTGNITQLKISGATSPTPTATRVSTITGPSTTSNDGATSPSAPADLRLAISQPEPAAPGAPIAWTVTVANAGPGGSSGATFGFDVPAGVTGLTLPAGCDQVSDAVQCVTTPLPDGGSDTFSFVATSPADAVVSSSSLVTVVGNELDLTDNTALLVVSAPDQALTTTRPGAQTHRISTGAPSGSTVSLVDDGDLVPSLTTPAGTYSVDGDTLVFTPTRTFIGTADPVRFEVRSNAERGTGTYTPTVTLPPAPAAGPFTSTGVGTAPQSPGSAITIPDGGAVALVDGPRRVVRLTVPEGTVDLGTDGTLTFTAVHGYAGTLPPFTYEVTDAYGTTAQGTYTPTVLAPAATTPAALTSTGEGTNVHAASPAVPTGGSWALHDDAGQPVTTLVVPGEGTYTVTASEIRFAPELGFHGPATPVTYAVTDAYGQTTTATFTPVVVPPTAPPAPPQDSTGTGDTTQETVVPVPPHGTVTLLDADGTPTLTVVVPGQGTYTLDPVSGALTFAPELGFDGPATSVSYAVTDVYGQTTVGQYTATVVPPAPPVALPVTTSGPHATPQHTSALPIPVGGTITLLDDTGVAVLTITRPAEGTFVLDPTTGVITFTPVVGFAGDTAPVDYRVTDAYDQDAQSTYVATVADAPVVTPGPDEEPAPVDVPEPPAPEPADEPTDEDPSDDLPPSLPRTGAGGFALAGVAGALVLAGAVLVAVRRRLES